MRILVADQNALLLAAIAATFGRHCEIVTSTGRDSCLEQMEQGQFDVVVACEKLADYTGLELLSEIEAASPATLRIFAAPPDSLRRLGKRLELFELLGTLSYPIEARKLLVALKVARAKLPPRPKPAVKTPPAVRHVVLEAEWDTGERLAILEHELEKAPPAPIYLAANDEAFVEEPAPAQPEPPHSESKTRSVAKGPRARKPSTPTAAQREAFQRALARRNAARVGEAEPATTKRPLSAGAGARQTVGAWRKVQPKRRVFVVGSGIAAVLLVGIVSFGLLRSAPPVEHGRHAHAREAQLFTPTSTLVADSSAGPPQVFPSPAPQPDEAAEAAALGMPQPQTFDPDTAPPDPPPPPVLEHPGPMEPPSMAHNGPPIGMQGADSSNGWNSE